MRELTVSSIRVGWIMPAHTSVSKGAKVVALGVLAFMFLWPFLLIGLAAEKLVLWAVRTLEGVRDENN